MCGPEEAHSSCEHDGEPHSVTFQEEKYGSKDRDEELGNRKFIRITNSEDSDMREPGI